MAELNVAFIRHVGPYEAVTDSLWHKLTDWAKSKRLPLDLIFLGIAHDAPGVTAPERLRFDAAIVVPGPFSTEGAIGHQVLSSAEFVVTTHVGHYRTLPQAMQEEAHRQPAVNHLEGDHIPWGWVAVTAVLLEVAIVISAIGWVAIYSYLIHPGEQLAHYQNYAQLSSPIVSVVLGIPYWFFGCRWAGRKAGTRAVAMCLLVWFILFIVDLALCLLGEPTAYVWAMVATSNTTKWLAAYLGGRAAQRDVSRMRLAFER